jgi:hypothetical protein
MKVTPHTKFRWKSKFEKQKKVIDSEKIVFDSCCISINSSANGMFSGDVLHIVVDRAWCDERMTIL